MLEINPFDQPNVQEAKDNTNRVLDEGAPELERRASLDDAGSTASSRRRYLAIMGYLPYSDETEAGDRAAAREA